MKEQSKGQGVGSSGRFGTFSGVFTPTVLTILGLILYLRLGWVVGQSGLAGALIIIAISNVITFCTGLSLSTLATNMRVRTGGTYYMIARTLGLEIGGAIGIPLYLSQGISVAFYLIGFTEAFHAVYPQLDPTLIATGLAILFGALAFVGADFIIKLQYGILVIIALSLISFFWGGVGKGVPPVYFAPETATASFWQVFAIFFPAVTGIMVGVSMSGDLKDARTSIPRGTLGAILLTALIYTACALWLGTHATTEELIGETMIMQKISAWPILILLGVWVSTLSSALGSIVAAPRTLQAIAMDRAVPKFMGSRLGSVTEPRLAVILTTVLALIVIWMGNLDFVAPIITMFFLNTYGMINLMAGIETFVGNPSFRPRLKVHWAVSLLGALGCYGAMFLINALATVIAILISYGVFVLLKRRSLKQDWGDVRSGLWFTVTRFGLLRLASVPSHVKNWRPNVVVFVGITNPREDLLEAGCWLASGRGIVTFYKLIVGELPQLVNRGLRTTAVRHLDKKLKEMGASAFVDSSFTRDFADGVAFTLQTHGIAGLEPNTALLGLGSTTESRKAQVLMARNLVKLKKSVLFLHHDPQRGFGRRKAIDVWWRVRDRNAELMLVLTHIIAHSPQWEGARIRIIRLLDSEEARGGAMENITRLLKSARVDAEPVIITRTDPDEPYYVSLGRTCRETDLIVMGIRIASEEDIDLQMEEIDQTLVHSGTTLMMGSGEEEDILNMTTVWPTKA